MEASSDMDRSRHGASSSPKFQGPLTRLSVSTSVNSRISPPLSGSKMSPKGADSPSEFMSPSNVHAWSGIVDPERQGILSGTNDANDSTVRYGDKIRLFSRSKYIEDESNLEGGYVGYYFRSRKGAKGEEGLILNGKETQLAVLSPAGPEKEILYHEVRRGGRRQILYNLIINCLRFFSHSRTFTSLIQMV